MRLVAFTDPHSSIVHMRSVEKLVKKHSPDAVVCAGDLTVFEQHVEEVIKWFGTLPVPVFLVHGNHEEESIIRKLCSFHENVTFLHKKIIPFKGFTFLGWGSGGFSFTEPAFEQWAKTIPALHNGILVTHQPAFGTKLDVVERRHVGSKSFKAFLEQRNDIVLNISGHIHECFGKTDAVGKSRLVNPGPSGKVVDV